MKLRDYQEKIKNDAYNILYKYGIVYLAMQVRTGKTITSISLASVYGAKKVLFITKKKAIDDIIGQAKEINYDMEIYVTNYDQLHKVEAKVWDVIIVDEAHSLGSFPKPSKRALELKRICGNTPLILLSGTPTPESYSQIYHQFWISNKSPFAKYVSFYKWAIDYVYPRKKFVFNKSINDYSFANYEMIKPVLDDIMITYTQEDAGFESTINEIIHHVKMDDLTYKMIEKLKRDKLITNLENETILADTQVKLMNKIHQICSGSCIIDKPERLVKCFDYTKANFILNNFAGKKIAIFYKFIGELHSITWILGKRITQSVDEFNEREDAIFVSQIVSGREGLNLSKADALIFYNIDYSALSYWQGMARIQTKDRVNTSDIHWIFALNGIEDQIYKAVSNKKDFTLDHFKKDYL